jgi:hypothetical protein
MSSVILNFNKNLDNGDAYKFSQFFDDKVQIPENATISLNNAQLTRKAIVVEEDSTITINLTNPNNDNNLARVFILLEFLTLLGMVLYQTKLLIFPILFLRVIIVKGSF